MSHDASHSDVPPTKRFPKHLRPLSRVITSHDSTGKAIFSDALPQDAPLQDVLDGAMQFSLMYTSSKFPVAMAADKDIGDYTQFLKTPPGITISTGTVCRVCDYPPYTTTFMHRTVSLDFGVVLEGEIELVLDSGETRRLKRGDVAVQRGTNHAWKNVTRDIVTEGKSVGQWARMFYVLQGAESLDLPGVGKLGEDYGEAGDGLPQSK